VLVYPVPVQGEGAAARIADAIRLASRRQDCDALLLVRGGGSLEDLWAFNEEVVARAIFECTIPLVTGIGHETDVTIADFVADLRAATPTAAAELACPDRLEWLRKVHLLEEQMERIVRRGLNRQHQRLDELIQRFVRLRPSRRLQNHAQRLDELDQRLHRALRNRLNRERLELAGLASNWRDWRNGYARRPQWRACARRDSNSKPSDGACARPRAIGWKRRPGKRKVSAASCTL